MYDFPIIPSLIATSLVMFTLAIFAWRKRYSGKAAIFLSISMLGVAVYSFGYGMELAAESLRTVMFWVRFQHFGIFLIAPTWLLFAVSVSGYEKKINLKLILALSVIPLYQFFTAQTLGWLNLAHHHPRLETLGPYQVLAYDRNIFNYISLGYYSLCLGISTVLFGMMYFRSAPASRKHLFLYLIGSLPPWAATIFYNLDADSLGLDYTPLLLGVSGLFFTFGFLKFRILDLIPLARNAIFEDMAAGVLIVDGEGQIVDFNPAFKKIFPEFSTSKTPDHETFFNDYPELKAWLRDKNQERVDFHQTVSEAPTYYRVSVNDITDRKGRMIGKIYNFFEYTQEKRLLDKLENLAIHDGLTGLYNRQYFDQLANTELSRLQRYGGTLALAMIDLDQFKTINDTYGHSAGDAVLVWVSKKLRETLRQSDLVARFGGEEFVILLPQTDLNAAEQLCKRLQKTLEENLVQYEVDQIPVKASFGVFAVNESTKLSLENLYRSADKALYQAKAEGGNTVRVFTFED